MVTHNFRFTIHSCFFFFFRLLKRRNELSTMLFVWYGTWSKTTVSCMAEELQRLPVLSLSMRLQIRLDSLNLTCSLPRAYCFSWWSGIYLWVGFFCFVFVFSVQHWNSMPWGPLLMLWRWSQWRWLRTAAWIQFKPWQRSEPSRSKSPTFSLASTVFTRTQMASKAPEHHSCI